MTSTCGTDKSSKMKRPDFHPYELAFCGYSGSGKTTVITNLIEKLSPEYSIGYVKHDTHGFEMDTEGKDTWKATQAGASVSFINTDSKFSINSSTPVNEFELRPALLASDWVFIEGYKNSRVPKIIVIDSDLRILEGLKEEQFKNVEAIIYQEGQQEQLADFSSVPQFERDNLTAIAQWVKNYFDAQVAETPIYGLILDGGKSSRMKRNKGLLEYYGKPQTEYLKELLLKQCDAVYISKNPEQELPAGFNASECIVDTFLDMGPVSGILSAQRKFPNATWLIVACDLPFLNEEIIGQLINERDPYKCATAFINPENSFPEPLFGLYEKKFYQRALSFVGQGFACPRKVLINSPIKKITSYNTELLTNANTPEDYSAILEKLEKQK